ncbi:MAG: hypothetical protein IPJ74_19965 [Saprospiraceae bacterium]|nr:hypothetical protein [Saprospiraceae bacterium]
MLLILFSQVLVLAQNNKTQENQADIINNRFFDGFYLGANVGSQNLFGGSFVDGVDILAQESRFVAELFTGFRKQFLKNRLLVGAEFQFGFTDGDLMHTDLEKQLEITYKNNTQSGFGLTLGVTLGNRKNMLLFAYGNETTRKFDVSITDRFGTYQQKDEQGMLKYGIGLEMAVYKKINIRATAGGLRVDFGNLETNINVEDKMDVTIGITYQF